MTVADETGRQNAAAARAVELANSAIDLGGKGQFGSAVDAAEEAEGLVRGLLRFDRATALPILAHVLRVVGVARIQAGRPADALDAANESVELYRGLVADGDAAVLPNLAMSVGNLGNMLNEVGRIAEALDRVREAVDLFRNLAAQNRQAFLPKLALGLNNLGGSLRKAGYLAEALDVGREAADLFRELAAGDREAFLPGLAMSLHNLGNSLYKIGRCAEALDAASESVELCRELVAGNREAFLFGLAMSLSSKGNRLGESGRHAEALNTAREAVDLSRELAAKNREAYLSQLASGLNNLSLRLSDAGNGVEALDAARESAELDRELVACNREAFLPDLATSLHNLGKCLAELDRAEALGVAQEAVGLRRELAARSREAFLPGLADSLDNLGAMLSRIGRSSEALQAVQEATKLGRELVAGNRETFLPNLAKSLNSLGARFSEVGGRAEALLAYRECGSLVIEWPPTEPVFWTHIARGTTLCLDTPQDLREWHLPVLRQLSEHRELAWDTELARLFLDLQGTVAARVWEMLATLPADEAALADEAVAVLVSALHSPDLARWLQARGQGDEAGPTAILARFKRDVIEAEQVLQGLMQQLRGGDAGTSGAQGSSSAEQAQQEALKQRIDEQAAKARALRESFRAERQRLIDADPRFRSAFELPDMAALRRSAAHEGATSLLCLVELSAQGEAKPRTVGALIDPGGGRSRLFEFEGLSETASHARWYQPGGDRSIGFVLRDSEGAPNAQDPAAAAPDANFEAIEEHMRQTFWRVLQQARDQAAADGTPFDRLHVCGHGLLQQLPLALRAERDCPGLQLLAWPGLPYLRLAEATQGNASQPAPARPWLIGHDCAWNSKKPLPMVAVEAELLRLLLQQHGQQVQSIERAADVHGGSAALVVCCHGQPGQHTAFDSALALGDPPLRVSQIVQQQLGPPLAVLPACYAGETLEDSAGNALGLAAGFLLGGTSVVTASSKSVPDMLMPWLSTLTVWHVMQGAGLHEAAQRAREQFGQCEFPEGYREWLQQALPLALQTLQPGGKEYEAAQRSAHGNAALGNMRRDWPWEGESLKLFDRDPDTRRQVREDLARHVLEPREDLPGLRDFMRQVAAFVFVYGVG